MKHLNHNASTLTITFTLTFLGVWEMGKYMGGGKDINFGIDYKYELFCKSKESEPINQTLNNCM